MIGYTYIVLAEMAIALIGFGVWVHHMFAVGLPTIGLGFISLTSFLVVIPSGVQIFAWLATLWAGKPSRSFEYTTCARPATRSRCLRR